MYFSSEMAMNTGLGLKMLMLTNLFGFLDGDATNYLLIIGLIADFIGVIALKYFTPIPRSFSSLCSLTLSRKHVKTHFNMFFIK